MPLSFGEFALGALGLAAFGGALAYGAVGTRAWLLAGWTGAPARLAEAVLWLFGVISVSTLLGTVGLLEPLPLLVGAVTVGIGLGRWARARVSRWPGGSLPAPSVHPLAAAAAFLAVAGVFAAWAIPAAQSFSAGIDGADSVWYHLPQAARFAQSASIWDLHFTDPYFLNWFYPQAGELLHALGMVAFERDLVSPLINFGFLALGLLAGWCVGRPWGLGPQTLIAAALVFGAEMTLDFQAGEARNDAVGLALFVAAVSLIVTARSTPSGAVAGPPAGWNSGMGMRAAAVAGIAAGLAAGTKLSLLAPVAALTIAVVGLGAAGTRMRLAWTWLAALAVGGGYWYLRNLIHSGNPLPWIGLPGLPAPVQALELRPEHSVAHYLGDWDVWGDWFVPGLGDGLGPLWATLLGFAAIGVLVTLAYGLSALRAGRRRPATTRPFDGSSARGYGDRPRRRPAGATATLAALGAVALASCLAYVITPLGASGEEGQPVGFLWNLRYLGPGLALALIIFPLAGPFRRGAWRWVTLVLLFAALVVQVVALGVWDFEEYGGWALAAGMGTLAVLLAGALINRRTESGLTVPKWAIAAGFGAIVAALLIAGQALQRSYLDARYENAFSFFELDEAIGFANGVSDTRIATAGRGGVFLQYGIYGADISNHVQWVGLPGPHGAWLPVETCEQWRQAVNDGDYDYVLTTFDGANPGNDETSVQRDWIEGDPAARLVLEDGPVGLFALDGELDLDGCV